ncbi:uncharacterized protein LOC143459747 isoform X3 [Clavelina lepadiformis]|uniref:uncharacterized protein LOC143459747 isoform X3 n=1 Tax=Clavelina lepadiformis TaxID=159417 RepID=UPI0040428792
MDRLLILLTVIYFCRLCAVNGQDLVFSTTPLAESTILMLHLKNTSALKPTQPTLNLNEKSGVLFSTINFVASSNQVFSPGIMNITSNIASLAWKYLPPPPPPPLTLPPIPPMLRIPDPKTGSSKPSSGTTIKVTTVDVHTPMPDVRMTSFTISLSPPSAPPPLPTFTLEVTTPEPQTEYNTEKDTTPPRLDSSDTNTLVINNPVAETVTAAPTTLVDLSVTKNQVAPAEPNKFAEAITSFNGKQSSTEHRIVFNDVTTDSTSAGKITFGFKATASASPFTYTVPVKASARVIASTGTVASTTSVFTHASERVSPAVFISTNAADTEVQDVTSKIDAEASSAAVTTSFSNDSAVTSSPGDAYTSRHEIDLTSTERDSKDITRRSGGILPTTPHSTTKQPIIATDFVFAESATQTYATRSALINTDSDSGSSFTRKETKATTDKQRRQTTGPSTGRGPTLAILNPQSFPSTLSVTNVVTIPTNLPSTETSTFSIITTEVLATANVTINIPPPPPPPLVPPPFPILTQIFKTPEPTTDRFGTEEATTQESKDSTQRHTSFSPTMPTSREETYTSITAAEQETTIEPFTASIKTSIDKPSPAQNITLVNIEYFDAKIRITSSLNDVDYYNVTIQRTDDSTGTVVGSSSLNQSRISGHVEVTALHPNTSYTIEVVSVLNGETSLPISTVVKTKPLHELIAEVRNITAVTAFVKWNEISDASAYEIRYLAGNDTATYISFANMHLNLHLESGRNYTVLVSALDTKNRSISNSAMVKFSTVPEYGVSVLETWANPISAYVLFTPTDNNTETYRVDIATMANLTNITDSVYLDYLGPDSVYNGSFNGTLMPNTDYRFTITTILIHDEPEVRFVNVTTGDFERPSNLTTGSVNPVGFALAWKAVPFADDYIVEVYIFSVRVRRRADDASDSNLVLFRKYFGIKDSNAVIDDLLPGEDYTIRVYAHVNSYVSDPIEFYESTAPLLKPTVAVSDTKPNSITVSLSPSNSTVQFYQLQIAPLGNETAVVDSIQINPEDVLPDASFVFQNNLIPDLPYVITATSNFGKATSDPDDVTSSTLPVPGPWDNWSMNASDSFVFIELIPFPDVEIIDWSKLTITGFTLNSSLQQEKRFPSNATNTTVIFHQLSPGTQYNISLVLITGGVVGPESMKTVTTKIRSTTAASEVSIHKTHAERYMSSSAGETTTIVGDVTYSSAYVTTTKSPFELGDVYIGVVHINDSLIIAINDDHDGDIDRNSSPSLRSLEENFKEYITDQYSTALNYTTGPGLAAVEVQYYETFHNGTIAMHFSATFDARHTGFPCKLEYFISEAHKNGSLPSELAILPGTFRMSGKRLFSGSATVNDLSQGFVNSTLTQSQASFRDLVNVVLRQTLRSSSLSDRIDLGASWEVDFVGETSDPASLRTGFTITSSSDDESATPRKVLRLIRTGMERYFFNVDLGTVFVRAAGFEPARSDEERFCEPGVLVTSPPSNNSFLLGFELDIPPSFVYDVIHRPESSNHSFVRERTQDFLNQLADRMGDNVGGLTVQYYQPVAPPASRIYAHALVSNPSVNSTEILLGISSNINSTSTILPIRRHTFNIPGDRRKMVMEFNLAGLSEDELIALNLNNFAKLATLFDGISVLLQSLFKEAGLSMTTYLKKFARDESSSELAKVFVDLNPINVNTPVTPTSVMSDLKKAAQRLDYTKFIGEIVRHSINVWPEGTVMGLAIPGKVPIKGLSILTIHDLMKNFSSAEALELKNALGSQLRLALSKSNVTEFVEIEKSDITYFESRSNWLDQMMIHFNIELKNDTSPYDLDAFVSFELITSMLSDGFQIDSVNIGEVRKFKGKGKILQSDRWLEEELKIAAFAELVALFDVMMPVIGIDGSEINGILLKPPTNNSYREISFVITMPPYDGTGPVELEKNINDLIQKGHVSLNVSNINIFFDIPEASAPVKSSSTTDIKLLSTVFETSLSPTSLPQINTTFLKNQFFTSILGEVPTEPYFSNASQTYTGFYILSVANANQVIEMWLDVDSDVTRWYVYRFKSMLKFLQANVTVDYIEPITMYTVRVHFYAETVETMTEKEIKESFQKAANESGTTLDGLTFGQPREFKGYMEKISSSSDENLIEKMNMLIMPRVTLSLIKSDEAPDIEQWKIRINELNKPFLITSSSWADDGSGGRTRRAKDELLHFKIKVPSNERESPASLYKALYKVIINADDVFKFIDVDTTRIYASFPVLPRVPFTDWSTLSGVIFTQMKKDHSLDETNKNLTQEVIEQMQWAFDYVGYTTEIYNSTGVIYETAKGFRTQFGYKVSFNFDVEMTPTYNKSQLEEEIQEEIRKTFIDNAKFLAHQTDPHISHDKIFIGPFHMCKDEAVVDCHHQAVCIGDETYFTCQCENGFTDKNLSRPGRLCSRQGETLVEILLAVLTVLLLFVIVFLLFLLYKRTSSQGSYSPNAGENPRDKTKNVLP